MNGQGCVPAELYLWTLKCEFHVIFTCHEILFLLFHPFKNVNVHRVSVLQDDKALYLKIVKMVNFMACVF